MEKNLTNGSVFKNIVCFSLPYLLSYFLQTLYGMADLYIIGRFEETVAETTAVSIGSQVMHMLTVMIVGLAMGTTVSIGQAVGANNKRKAASAIGNTVTIFMLISALLTVLLLFLVKPVTRLMSAPQEAVADTVKYLTICFAGIPFITAYNVLSSIFRGMGDSKSPMYFVSVACVANIALDYLFIGVFRMGPAGAALGTTLSQAISVIISLVVILKRRSVEVVKSDFRPVRSVMSEILKIGVPIALQDGFIQVAFIFVTVIATGADLPIRRQWELLKRLYAFCSLFRPRCFLPFPQSVRRISAQEKKSAQSLLSNIPALSRCATARWLYFLFSLLPSRLSDCLCATPPLRLRAANISKAMSGTYFLPEYSSASADISVRAENLSFRFCITLSQL